MGLDMYFEGTFSTRAFTERSLDKTEVALDPSFESLLESIGFEDAPKEFTNWNYYSVNIPIAYWRKVNCIHNWFVENVQGGDDNCERHWVSRENLEDFLETINTILAVKTPVARRTKAEELLPTDIEGCFFGSEDYDDWYYQDLKRTKSILEKVFDYEENAEAGKCFDNFYYQSSW